MTETKQSEVGEIRRLVLKKPEDAFKSPEFISEQWKDLNYEAPPDLDHAIEEHSTLCRIFLNFGIELHFLKNAPGTGLDSIYVRDAAIVCDDGVILCNMGKSARIEEPRAQEPAFRELGVPILGAVSGEGTIEGGDVAWIDQRTIAVGRGYRTNDEGIRQLRELLGATIDEMMVVPLPHWRGPEDVFHLMSILSPIDHDLLLVYSPLLPVPFREALLDRGCDLVEVPESEFFTMGINVLTVAPRVCVMLAGNPITKRRLEDSGARVIEFKGDEICAKGAGGPTCLTRPLERGVF